MGGHTVSAVTYQEARISYAIASVPKMPRSCQTYHDLDISLATIARIT